MIRSLYSVKNYFWFAASTFLMLATPIFILFFLNHSVDKVTVGMYAHALALTAPLQAMIGINMRAFISINQLRGYSIEDIFAQRSYVPIFIVLGAIIAEAPAGLSMEALAMLIALSLFRTSECLSDITVGIMQRAHRADLIALSYFAKSTIGALVFIGIFYISTSVSIGMIGLAILTIILTFSLDLRILRICGEKINWGIVFATIKTSKPLLLTVIFIPAALLNLIRVLENNVARYFVEFNLGMVDLGVYTSIGFLVSAISNLFFPIFFMTFASFGQWIQSKDALLISKARSIYIANLGLTLIAMCIIILSGYLLSNKIISFYLNDSTPLYREVFFLLCLGGALSLLQSCVGFALTGLGVIQWQTNFLIIKIVVFVTILIFGIFPLTLTGIAYATVVSWVPSTCLALIVAEYSFNNVRNIS